MSKNLHRYETNGESKPVPNGLSVSRSAPFSQSLSSVLNHPPQASVVSLLLSGDYQAIWESPQRLLGFSADSTWSPPPLPPMPPGYPTITLDDFKQYLADMSTLMAKFEAIHPIAQGDGAIDERTKGPNATDNLAQELKEVPEVFFKEGFNLEEPDTFELSGASCEGLKSKMMQERLSHYLDVVEQQLMRQIQARSDSFYKALDTLQELYAEVDVTLRAIVEFRAVIRRLDENLVGHALRVAQVPTAAVAAALDTWVAPTSRACATRPGGAKSRAKRPGGTGVTRRRGSSSGGGRTWRSCTASCSWCSPSARSPPARAAPRNLSPPPSPSPAALASGRAPGGARRWRAGRAISARSGAASARPHGPGRPLPAIALAAVRRCPGWWGGGVGLGAGW